LNLRPEGQEALLAIRDPSGNQSTHTGSTFHQLPRIATACRYAAQSGSEAVSADLASLAGMWNNGLRAGFVKEFLFL
jgi:hypothetical protein